MLKVCPLTFVVPLVPPARSVPRPLVIFRVLSVHMKETAYTERWVSDQESEGGPLLDVTYVSREENRYP